MGYSVSSDVDRYLRRSWKGRMSRLILLIMYPLGFLGLMLGLRWLAERLGLLADYAVVFAISLAVTAPCVLLTWAAIRTIRLHVRKPRKVAGNGSSFWVEDPWLDCGSS
jgi:hypothetical protein